MTTTFPTLGSSLLVGLALLLQIGCSANSTAPTPTPSLLSVTCEASALGAVGQQAHCQARLTLSDSTTQDETASAQWSSSDPDKVSVSPAGVIEAVAPGSAGIAAVVRGLTGRQTITVNAACKFSVSPAALSFPANGGSQAVTVTATPLGCSPSGWTAASAGSGLTFAPAAGDGNGLVMVTATANIGAAQALTATVAGEPLTVTLGAAPPLRRTLSLTLAQGEQLSGPWAGTVTSINGFSCTLNQRDDKVTCPSLTVEDGTKVDLLVSLAPQLAKLGHPMRRGFGCDARTESVCTVVLDRDKSVTIEIGWEVSPIR
jgi:Bacterial Ig-like domain (group 2)